MVLELRYNVAALVFTSWEQLKQIENYEKAAGVVLFQHLFERCPQAKVLFGFPIDIDPNAPELLTSKSFIMHASYLIRMLDTALNMLGPDIELLTDIMTELGNKHVRYGVKQEMFPIMGDALMYTLKTILKADFTEPVNDAWLQTYRALSQDMLRAQVKAKTSGKENQSNAASPEPVKKGWLQTTLSALSPRSRVKAKTRVSQDQLAGLFR